MYTVVSLCILFGVGMTLLKGRNGIGVGECGAVGRYLAVPESGGTEENCVKIFAIYSPSKLLLT
jgi:hypothetical protein